MLTQEELTTLAETTLVVVADSVTLDRGDVHWLSTRLDQTEQRHVDELSEAIKPLLRSVVVYKSPDALIDNISKHRDHLVLPDWGGAKSWSRMGLLPAICEAYGIAYIGGDAYTKIVCQDKFLTKTLCERSGLKTPRAIYVDTPAKLDALSLLTYPCVVKPCFEGSSIGIDHRSLAPDAGAARALAGELLQALGSPILVEAFCPGREVSICMLGNPNGVSLLEAGERYIPGDEQFFYSNVFSFELKKNSKRTALRRVTPDVPAHVMASAVALFHSLAKVEIIRIDGRLDGDSFNVIELTPDTHLGARAEYAGTFIQSGLTYQEVIARMVLNSIEAARGPSASTQTTADSSRISS